MARFKYASAMRPSMDTGDILEKGMLLLTRAVVVVATVIGGYLLVEGDTILRRVFGLVLVASGLYLLYHHSLVALRGSMENGEN